jgi:hypothetical protein
VVVSPGTQRANGSRSPGPLACTATRTRSTAHPARRNLQPGSPHLSSPCSEAQTKASRPTSSLDSMRRCHRLAWSMRSLPTPGCHMDSSRASSHSTQRPRPMHGGGSSCSSKKTVAGRLKVADARRRPAVLWVRRSRDGQAVGCKRASNTLRARDPNVASRSGAHRLPSESGAPADRSGALRGPESELSARPRRS